MESHGIHSLTGTAGLMVMEARLATAKAAELNRPAQKHVGWQASAMERRREGARWTRG
jgi:hypothetical protein